MRRLNKRREQDVGRRINVVKRDSRGEKCRRRVVEKAAKRQPACVFGACVYEKNREEA